MIKNNLNIFEQYNVLYMNGVYMSVYGSNVLILTCITLNQHDNTTKNIDEDIVT